MKNMDDALLTFIDAIKSSEEYQDYVREKERVKQLPELKAQIDEYRRRNYLLQNSGEPAFEKLDEFEREYGKLRENTMAADFLAAELAFCRMMQSMNLRITDALDFE